MYTNTTGSTANYYYYQHPQPNICPGCGRCNECGRITPAPAYPPFVNPWITWGDNSDSTTLTTVDSANTAFNTEIDADERDD